MLNVRLNLCRLLDYDATTVMQSFDQSDGGGHAFSERLRRYLQVGTELSFERELVTV